MHLGLQALPRAAHDSTRALAARAAAVALPDGPRCCRVTRSVLDDLEQSRGVRASHPQAEPALPAGAPAGKQPSSGLPKQVRSQDDLWCMLQAEHWEPCCT